MEIVSHICIPFLLHFTPAYLGVRGGGQAGRRVVIWTVGGRGEGGGGAGETSKLCARALGASMGVEVALPLCEYRGEECHPRTFDIRRVAVSAMCGSFVRLVSRDSSY